MLDQTHAEADLEKAAASLLNAPLITAAAAAGGGNNRVYRAETADGVYAIKFYPRQDADPRDRLGHEFAALELMSANGIASVPQAFARDDDLGCAAYEWIEGDAPGAISDADVDAMTAFAETLGTMSADTETAAIQPASASCFSGEDVTAQFADRLARLRAAADDEALHTFLDTRLQPGFAALNKRAHDLYEDAGLDFAAALGKSARTLSPSDFGFHNARRRKDGRLVFLDFEYFGWDDPVKMIADAVWHPGSAIPDDAQDRIRNAMLSFFAARDGEALRTRFEALSPLFGAIWCLIVLNEFLPERWARRVAAGGAGDAAQARARQLKAADALFTKVTTQYND